MTALVVALTPRSAACSSACFTHLAEEFEADHEATRPLIEVLEKAMTAKEAHRVAVGMTP